MRSGNELLDEDKKQDNDLSTQVSAFYTPLGSGIHEFNTPLASLSVDMSSLSVSNSNKQSIHSESMGRRSSAQIEYIQELLQNMPAEDRDSLPLAQLSPNQLESETMLTSMIDDIQGRLNGLNKTKDKTLLLTLQTLKSALVAERSQLQAARTDPMVLHDDDDGDQEEEVTYEPSLDETAFVTPGTSPSLAPSLKERLAVAITPAMRIEPLLENPEDGLARSEVFQASLRTRLSAKKFVAYAWCSWCFKQTVHGRAQRNMLRRSRYKCTECSQTTLKCRTHCGAMARGHSDYDEELCARCDGTLGDWGDERPSKTGYCSSCFHRSTHHLIHRGYVLHDTYRCGYCKAPTFLCATCQTNFGAFESNLVLISELLHYTCALCGDQISSWEDPVLRARRHLGSSESSSSAASFYRKPLMRYQHPFESFAEVRAQVACEALVDGEEFYTRSYQWISEAKDTIFLSCWWLAPFVHLQRSMPLKNSSRLSDLLWSKANEGVRIYGIIWHNSVFLSLCSEEAKQLLEANHPNIYVMRHPSYTLPNFMWTHHQKFLAIDYSRAIVGGLDYAIGRFDTPEHRLTDLGIPTQLRPPSPSPRVPPC
ncbi:Phospholipase D1 [Entomophthora muscae]|uniref:Phospholipase D1 n=1 Tax=Entomophthora muscae TaxID=34485 RepID=A0ACC2RRV7_9FUNG|nr:Phospholipase D1 [Entomophthora muscae]